MGECWECAGASNAADTFSPTSLLQPQPPVTPAETFAKAAPGWQVLLIATANVSDPALSNKIVARLFPPFRRRFPGPAGRFVERLIPRSRNTA